MDMFCEFLLWQTNVVFTLSAYFIWKKKNFNQVVLLWTFWPDKRHYKLNVSDGVKLKFSHMSDPRSTITFAVMIDICYIKFSSRNKATTLRDIHIIVWLNFNHFDFPFGICFIIILKCISLKGPTLFSWIYLALQRYKQNFHRSMWDSSMHNFDTAAILLSSDIFFNFPFTFVSCLIFPLLVSIN